MIERTSLDNTPYTYLLLIGLEQSISCHTCSVFVSQLEVIRGGMLFFFGACLICVFTVFVRKSPVVGVRYLSFDFCYILSFDFF